MQDLQAEISNKFKQLSDQFADAYANSMGRSDSATKMFEAQDNFLRAWNRAAPEAQQEFARRVRDLYRKYIHAIQDAVAHANFDQCTPMELAMAGQLLYAVAQQVASFGMGVLSPGAN
ncbi:MAG TPA: hypothetical protein VFT22_04535 [Kofleriaceae bacterium]|nr:hypothetical protein [Kofleriaceae bacterium]